jgi:4-amino-4-deoxy-L-arabinose transferase-like glycosyltransferase
MIEDHISYSSPSGSAQLIKQVAMPEWPVLVALLVFAVVVRLAFFNGSFGSDDLVYLAEAVQISEGIWTSSDYIGALRYGFNIPAGFFAYLFGLNSFTINLWSLLCSLAEIVTVYLFAASLWNRRIALYSGLILICMPLHIAVSTRLHSDPVVSFFLTLSFVLFFLAERQRNRLLYLLTGIAMGLVFWAKEIVTAIMLFAFAFYPLIFRKLEIRWLLVIGGGLIMLVAHFMLMIVIADDPLHVFKLAMTSLDRAYTHGNLEDEVWYYFWYLFIDIKHTWLAPFLAAAMVITVIYRRVQSAVDEGVFYVTFWLVCLLTVLSFTPIKINPLQFIVKQSNYLSLFLAPIALLAGYQIAQLSRRTAVITLLTTLIGGVALGALEQQAYNVFTSNSKAAVEFSKKHTDSWIIGSINNGNIALMHSIFEKNPDLKNRFIYLDKELLEKRPEMPAIAMATPGYVILDWETMPWGRDAVQLTKPLSCWQEVTRLIPTGFGLSQPITEGILSTIKHIPGVVGQQLATPFQKLSQPKPAIVYRVDRSTLWCDGKEVPATSQ